MQVNGKFRIMYLRTFLYVRDLNNIFVACRKWFPVSGFAMRDFFSAPGTVNPEVPVTLTRSRIRYPEITVSSQWGG
jgi:hypothetical protein